MPKTAFILLKSPQEHDPKHMLSRLADRDDSVAILLEDGVYHALTKHAAEGLAAAAREVVVSQEDLEARGFSAGDLRVGRTGSYLDIVELIMERTERTVTL